MADVQFFLLLRKTLGMNLRQEKPTRNAGQTAPSEVPDMPVWLTLHEKQDFS
jgi:hypothetical protein